MPLDVWDESPVSWPSHQGGHRGQPRSRLSLPQSPRRGAREGLGHDSELPPRLRLLLDLPPIARCQGREGPDHPTPHPILGRPHADQGQQPEHDPGPHLRAVCHVSLDGPRRPAQGEPGLSHYQASRADLEASRGGDAGTDGPDMGDGGLWQEEGGSTGQGRPSFNVAGRGETERGPHGRVGVYRPDQESLGYPVWEGWPDPMGAPAGPGHAASIDLMGEPGQARVGPRTCHSAGNSNQQPSPLSKDQADLPEGRDAPRQPPLVPAHLCDPAWRDRGGGQPCRPREDEADPGAQKHRDHTDIPPCRGAGPDPCGPRLRQGRFRERRYFDSLVSDRPKGGGFGSFSPPFPPTTHRTNKLNHSAGLVRAHTNVARRKPRCLRRGVPYSQEAVQPVRQAQG